ncbi:hypothetical protein CQA18_24845, partial [Enterobacter hormaechei]|uniref:methyltransferase domain-containing protein n=1 Tax=Enterobacter hormaechei TaxID=158836 RepID=UPI000BC654EA
METRWSADCDGRNVSGSPSARHLVTDGYVESLPFADNAFDIVISRYSAHHWHDVGAALR